MDKPHRIAAGGIIFKGDENIVQAIIRETKEETGVSVEPKRVAAIEDLLSPRTKMIKVWMVCEFVEGEVHPTGEAEKEGIIEAAWFTKDELAGEVVYPSPLMQYDWEQLRSETWQVECLPSRRSSF